MSRSASSDGYVTLAVLVIAGLLAALVSALLAVSRPGLALARFGADEAAAGSLVEGGLQAAGYLLFTAERDARSVSGLVLRFRGGNVQLRVADESGRIDLNAAEPAILAGLYAAAGGRSLTPSAFAARVIDWRDRDSQRGESGAEADDYEAEELAWRPPDGPFRSAEDLRFILGLSRDDVARLMPFVTVYTATKAIDPLSAPMTVLRAVPGLSEAEARRIIAVRDAGPEGEEALAALLSPYAGYFQTDVSRVYRVGVAARLRSGHGEAAEAVIMAPADEGGDFRVVAWSRPARGAPR